MVELKTVREAPYLRKQHMMALYRDARLIKSKLEMLLLATVQPNKVSCWHHMPMLKCSVLFEIICGGYTQTNQTQQKPVCRPPHQLRDVVFLLFFFCFNVLRLLL